MKMCQVLGRKTQTAPSSHCHTVGDLVHLSPPLRKCVGDDCPGIASRLGCLVESCPGSGNTSQCQPAALQPRLPLYLLGQLLCIQKADVQTKFVPGFGSLIELVVSGPVLIDTQLG